MTVRIGSACTACGLCVVTCPEGALVPARHRPDVVLARCSGCMACVEVCPRDAVAVSRSGGGEP